RYQPHTDDLRSPPHHPTPSPSLRPHKSPTLCPYTTLFRSVRVGSPRFGRVCRPVRPVQRRGVRIDRRAQRNRVLVHEHLTQRARDRKSTRLNSSHVKNSYAVFCLKKKKHAQRTTN